MFAGSSLALGASARADEPLSPYLPKSGTIVGHVVTFAIPDEDAAINARFRHAVQDNMDWFKKAVTSNKPGQPLPYDPHMGITEAEYHQLEHMKPVMKQGEAVTITVKKAADGGVTFDTADSDAESLKSVSFPPDEMVAKTPYGTLSIFNKIDQKDPDAPLGVWTGVEWAQVKARGSDEPSAKLAFGRQANGSGLMYYQVAAYPGHKEQSLVLTYKLD